MTNGAGTEDSGPARAGRPGGRPAPRAHVLVAEDDAEAARMITRYLESRGFLVTTTSDGASALDVLESLPIDIVLLDLMMPNVDGFGVLQRMRSQPAQSRVPVIVTTAAASPEDTERALEHGADDFVTKPYDLRGLVARIDGRLKRRGKRPSNVNDVDVGTLLDDKYLLEERIDGGGYGVVYRARHTGLQSPIAIKLLRTPARAKDDLDSLLVEGVTACRVQHPNAVRVHDFSVLESGLAYLVMELLNGPSLESVLQAGTMPLPRAAQVLVPVCHVLSAAHAVGIVHRDVKPANIVLHQSPTGELVKVVDFGIARLVDPERRAVDATGSAGGSLGYIAPEVLQGLAHDGKADVYSTGVVLYRALTGRFPVEPRDTGVAAMVLSALEDDVLPPSTYEPALPRAVDDLVLAALDRRPEARPSAAELGRMLRTSLVYG